MDSILEIENKIATMEPGKFQVFCDGFLYCKGFKNRMSLGTQTGTGKTTKGTPDTYFYLNDKYYFAEYTTQKKNLAQKILADIKKCFDESYTKIPTKEIAEIIYCHTSSNLSPFDDKMLRDFCVSYNVSLQLFGVNSLANEIFNEYPWLSSEYLGIDLGTKEITDHDGFVKYYKNLSVGPPLSNKFILREEEKTELEDGINQKDVVIVLGKAGVGKTRLVLEVCNQYAIANDYQLYCVRSSQGLRYTNISRVLASPKKKIVFFDDANKLSGLQQIFELASMKSDIKLVLTARDYVIEKIKNELREVFSPNDILRRIKSLRIKPFSDEDIGKLAKDSFGIVNQAYVKRIISIASGNARLAVMACELAEKNQNLNSIRDASQLYDSYYYKTMNEVFGEKRECAMAGIAAMISPFDLKNDLFLEPIMDKLEISMLQMHGYMFKLHEMEIVDLMRDQAIQFTDQSLQNYLVKYVFIDQRIILLSDIVICAYATRSEAVIRSINSLFQVFGSDDVIEKIKKQINISWDYFYENHSLCFEHFLENFCIFRPEETLNSIKREIDSMDYIPFNVTTIDFSKKECDLASDRILSIITRFCYGEYSKVALQIILRYFLRRPKTGLKVYKVLTEFFCFDPEHISCGYHRELNIAKELAEFINKCPSCNNEFMFVQLARFLLKFDFLFLSEGRTGKIQFTQGDLPYHADTIHYRAILWRSLLKLHENNKQLDHIEELIFNYRVRLSLSDASSKIINTDIPFLGSFFKGDTSIENTRYIILANHIATMFENIQINVPKSIERFLKAESCKTINLLMANDYSISEDWVTRRKKHDDERNEYTSTITETDIDNIFKIYEDLCALPRYLQDSNHAQGFCKILYSISTTSPHLYEYTMKNFLEKDIVLQCGHNILVAQLIKIIGFDSTMELIKKSNLCQKDIWLFWCFASLHESDISKNSAKQLLQYFRSLDSPITTVSSYLDIFVFAKYKKCDPEILISISEILYQIYEKETLTLNIYLGLLFNTHLYSPQDVIDEYRDSPKLLKDIYLALLSKSDPIDYDGSFLKEMCTRGICTLEEVLNCIPEHAEVIQEHYYGRFKFIWKEENYIELADIMFDWFCKKMLPRFQYRCEFLSICDAEYLYRHDNWFEHSIKKYAFNLARISELSIIICELSSERRIKYILLFLKYNKSLNAFQRWKLCSRVTSGFPSLVPAFKERLDLLIKLKNELIGIDYLGHLDYLEAQIRIIKKEIENEELADFLSEFN